MMELRDHFSRKETKYIVSETQLACLMEEIAPYIRPDEYGETDIYNCYYDTPDFLLIRRSLEKPFYKEKLRLRCYGAPTDLSDAFIEVKKKCDGIVYKRRIVLPYAQAVKLLSGETLSESEKQIAREVDWMFRLYPELSPAMVIMYHRRAYYSRTDANLRLTVDRNLRYRIGQTDLRCKGEGSMLLAPDQCLLELKLASSMPLLLSAAMSKNGIFRTSFSKYGKAYCHAMQPQPIGGFEYV